jgi:hypothetical protein
MLTKAEGRVRTVNAVTPRPTTTWLSTPRMNVVGIFALIYVAVVLVEDIVAVVIVVLVEGFIDEDI